MTTDLREELSALADTQSFSPDPSAWDRGRRERRRDRVVRGAAVLAVVGVLGGTLIWVTGDRDARTASTEVVEGGAIPSRIKDVPADLEVTTDLVVGRGSAAFISASGDPVVITAADGKPHRLNLSGWEQDAIGLALSPDGTKLAFQEDPGVADTYLAVLDLETGRTDRAIVHPDQALMITELTWSPSGTRLAWLATANNGDLPVVGQVRASFSRGQRIVPPSNVVDVAVADDGTSVIGRARGGLFVSREQEGLTRISSDPTIGAGAFSPDDRYVALRSAPSAASYTLDTSTGTVLDHPFPENTFASAAVRPLGWLDDRLQLLLLQDPLGEGSELVVTTPQVDTRSTWRRSVGSVDGTISNSVTVAVDLIPDLDGTSSQELTYDFDHAARDSWERGTLPYVLGGLMVLLSGLAFIRMVQKRA